MAPQTTILRTAQALSTSLALLSSGVALAESFLLVPRLLESPVPLMLRQWASTFHTSKRFFRAATIPTAVVFYVLSWQHAGAGRANAWKLCLAAGVLCSSVGPYTWAVVMPTNRELLRRGDECVAAEKMEEMPEVVVQRGVSARGLVDRWGVLNLPRVAALGVAGVLGVVAAHEV